MRKDKHSTSCIIDHGRNLYRNGKVLGTRGAVKDIEVARCQIEWLIRAAGQTKPKFRRRVD